MTRLVVSGLSHRYRGTAALDGIDLDVGPGVTALLGVNGAGKSTLMSVCAGIVAPIAGVVRIGDAATTGRTRRRALRRVALMPQLTSFPSNLTARDVVTYLAWLKGAGRARATTRADESLTAVGLASHADQRCGALSGGMLRRVALAQALACDAEVLLLDEPSTGLDPRQRHGMVELLRGLTGTVLMSSHVVEDVEDLADRVLVLDGGRLVFDGTTEELAQLAPDGGRRSRVEAGFLHVTGHAVP